MTDIAAWVAPVATMMAAIMTAANLGTRITGWGFAVFAIGAVAWITIGAVTGQRNLLVSNAFLLLVDVVGMWRWLGRRARYDEGAAAARRRSDASDAPTLFPLSSIEGMALRDRQGGAIATAVDAMARCDDGAIAYLVVREGGVGGVGERLHAVGWHEVRVTDGALVTRLDAEAITRRRQLGASGWPASAAAAGVG